MSATVAKSFFKELPFPVHPSQRPQLQQYKALAVAKEKALAAKKKERLVELQKYVAERLEEKRGRPRHVVQVPVLKDETRSSGSSLRWNRQPVGGTEALAGSHTAWTSVRHSAPPWFSSDNTTGFPILPQQTGSGMRHTTGCSIVPSTTSSGTTIDHTTTTMPAISGTIRNTSGHSSIPQPVSTGTTTGNTTGYSAAVKSNWLSGDRETGMRRSGMRSSSTVPVQSASLRQSPESLLGAVARGYLTRKLFRSPQVQAIVHTVKDLQEVLESLQEPLSAPDQQLKRSTMAQLSLARHQLHTVFNLLPSKQMLYLSSRHHQDTGLFIPSSRHSDHTHNRTPGLRSIQKNPPLIQHSSGHSKPPVAGPTSSNKRGGPVSQHNPKGGGGVGGGKLSAATIKCMQRRRKTGKNN